MDLIEKAAQRLAQLQKAGIDAPIPAAQVTQAPPTGPGAERNPYARALGAGVGTGAASRQSRRGSCSCAGSGARQRLSTRSLLPPKCARAARKFISTSRHSPLRGS